VDDNALHPTPQFAAAAWTGAARRMGIAFDDANAGMAEHWEARRDPFHPEHHRAVPAGIARQRAARDRLSPGRLVPVCAIRVERPAGRERLMLHFGAVDYRAAAWVNGRLAAVTRGPYAVRVRYHRRVGREPNRRRSCRARRG